MTLQEIQYKAQAIMQEWRDEDSAPYVEFVEELASMDVPELPEGLEEAAEEWCKRNNKGIALSYDGSHYLAEGIDAFIAGAEYQRKQDQSLIELAEDHAMLAGMNKMKEEMMEKAVGGRYMKAASSVYVESWPLDIEPDSVKAGSEVRLIVIPEEK